MIALALGASVSAAHAQNPLAAAKQKAEAAKAKSDAQTEAMQQPEGKPAVQPKPVVQPKPAVQPKAAVQPKSTASTAAEPTKAAQPAAGAQAGAQPRAAAGDVKDPDLTRPAADTAGPPPTIYREIFAYGREGRRDPFVSLMNTNDLRPTISDLRLTGVLYDHAGGNSLATFRDVTNNQQYRVGVGSALGRMRVTAIRTTTVVFTIDEFGTTRRDSMVLRDSTNKARGR